jgi:hypothetical protein
MVNEDVEVCLYYCTNNLDVKHHPFLGAFVHVNILTIIYVRIASSPGNIENMREPGDEAMSGLLCEYLPTHTCTRSMPDPGHRLTLFHKHKRQAKDDDTTTIHPMGIKQRAQQRNLSAQLIPDPQGGSKQSHYQ